MTSCKLLIVSLLFLMLLGASIFCFASYGGEMHQDAEAKFYAWFVSFMISLVMGLLVFNTLLIFLAAKLLHLIAGGARQDLCWVKLASHVLLYKQARSIAADILFYTSMHNAFHLKAVTLS